MTIIPIAAAHALREVDRKAALYGFSRTTWLALRRKAMRERSADFVRPPSGSAMR